MSYTFISCATPKSRNSATLWKIGILKILESMRSNSPLLTLERIMLKNDQAHFKDLAANAAKFSKCVGSFFDVIH